MDLKDYKIAWFTEGGWQGKVSLDNPNMRNDVSTKYVLGAEHFPIFQIPQVFQHFGENHFDSTQGVQENILFPLTFILIPHIGF